MDTSRYLSERVNQLSESATIKMAQLARDVTAEGHDVINLSLGEPDFDTPVHIKEAAKAALDKGFTKYTPVPGLTDLRKAISIKLERENNLRYSTNQVVVSNGAKQCIANICLAMLNPGDEVVIFTPYWVSYYEIVKFAGGVPVTVSAGIDKDFKVTAEQLSEAINDNTRLVLFSSPCNPSGSVYTREELSVLADVIKQHEGVFVVSDEIYEYINFTGEHASIGAIDGMIERTITVNGMSKGFSMTGWRLGYMAGPQWITDACSKIQGQFTSGASSFGQKASVMALSGDLSATRHMRDEFLKRKKLVLNLLKEIPGIQANDPQGAFYVFPNISSFFGKSNGTVTIQNADDFALNTLQYAHVALVSGSAFGNDDCVRFSYAASEEQLVEGMRRLKKFLAGFE